MEYKRISELSPGDIFFRWDVSTRGYEKGMLLSIDDSTANVYLYRVGESQMRIHESVSIDPPPPFLNR
jgi:hypothetical protein